jgi:hypothetical protein
MSLGGLGMDEDPENMTGDELARVAEMAKHAQALGNVSLSWTRLHEVMAMLFGLLLRPAPEERAYAIWHSIKNDRAQRDMLQALAETVLPPNGEALKAIKWAIGSCVPLEDARNDALHSPYVLIHDQGGPRMISNVLTGNRRATKLKGRDLDLELESYNKNFTAVADYLWEVVRRLSASGNALALGRFGILPPPPSLPKPAQAMTRRRRKSK